MKTFILLSKFSFLLSTFRVSDTEPRCVLIITLFLVPFFCRTIFYVQVVSIPCFTSGRCLRDVGGDLPGCLCVSAKIIK